MVTDKPNRPNWAVGGDQYLKAPRPAISQPPIPPVLDQMRSVAADQQHADTGISWQPVDLSTLQPSGVDRARFRFRSSLPDLIWNTARLEGNNFTLPEVRTLLDGVTVGGRRRDDENQILALSEAYNALEHRVGDGTFAITKEVSDRLNGMVARYEAIESGHFRGEGAATGGGTVKLASGGAVPGTPHGDGGQLLRHRFATVYDHLAEVDDPREQALVYFAAATRSQFYFDGNKRTARLMMSGILMSAGYDAINIPYARRLEYNHALDRLFSTDDGTELIGFLATAGS